VSRSKKDKDNTTQKEFNLYNNNPVNTNESLFMMKPTDIHFLRCDTV
jgi:hypothetical protein